MNRLYEFTPGLMTSEVLISISMGRDREIARIESILENASNGGGLSNPIFIGPKGIGKTHILNIIYRSIAGDRKMNEKIALLAERFIPVLFSEEEYVSDITKFVLTILRYLPNSPGGKSISIPSELTNPTRITEKERMAAVSFLKKFKEKTGKFLLLFIDNINDIIGNFTREDQAALRDILMTTDAVLIIGAAPTLFDAIINYNEPFYNFFETIRLSDFSYKETTELLNRFASIEANDELKETIKKSKSKIKAIHELTGGNPRLILTLIKIIDEGDVASAEDMLITLLDKLSSYFRERMRDLAKQQMEIIDIMARAETLLTPTEIAAAIQLPVNTVNSQLARLEKNGYVKNTTPKRKRTVFYDINERLFSLWRQMRVDAGRKRLSLIVRFYEIWFSKEELQSYLDKTLNDIIEKGISDECELDKYIDMLYYYKEALPEFKGIDEAYVALQKGNYKAAIVMLEKKIKNNHNDYLTWYSLGLAYSIIGQHNKAIDAYNHSIEINSDDYSTWYNLGLAYSKIGQYDKAIDAYNHSIKINPDDYSTWNNLGFTYSKIGQYDKAIDAFNHSIEINSDDYITWNNLGNAYYLTKEYEKAIDAYNHSLDINTNRYIIWNNLGNAYYKAGQYENAIIAYLHSVKIKPDRLDTLRNLFILFDLTFTNESIKGNTANATDALQKMLEVSSTTILKKEIQDFFVKSFTKIAKSKKYDFLRLSLDAIKKAGEDELYELLMPFDIIVRFQETKNENVIERLKPEVRTIVDAIMKEIEMATETHAEAMQATTRTSSR
ncbi:MAG: tetratricopeptide repeat protein [Nitrospirota bacterium]